MNWEITLSSGIFTTVALSTKCKTVNFTAIRDPTHFNNNTNYPKKYFRLHNTYYWAIKFFKKLEL